MYLCSFKGNLTKVIDKQLQLDIAKRVKIQFGNHAELDHAIDRNNEKATEVFEK